MNALILWSGHPVVNRLGWTLLHFLWQGAAIACLFACAQAALRNRSSHARYCAGCLALALMLAAPVVTFISLQAKRALPQAAVASATPLNPVRAPALAQMSSAREVGQDAQLLQAGTRLPLARDPQSAIRNPQFSVLHSENLLPALVLAWLLGATALSLRLLFSSLHVARLKRRGNEPPGQEWLARLDRLKAALPITRPVRLVKSVLVEVPAVVGWLRPVILLPAASLAGLTPAQLEAILAHELAHIRRHDYLVNLLQNALETLLFYHPAVWWISNCVRAEREICCDEIAVELCGDRLVYAKALAALEEMRAGRPSLALGADGGSLLERIRHITGAPPSGNNPARRRAGGVLVAALVAIISISLLHQPANNAKAQATTPAKRNQTNAPAESPNPQPPIRNPQSGGPSKPDPNPPGLSVEIRCATNVFKLADEIPVQIIFSNHGPENYSFQRGTGTHNYRLVGYTLTAKSPSGETLPDLRTKPTNIIGRVFGPLWQADSVLRPGESVTNTTPLNRWALLKEPGRYEVVGAYADFLVGPFHGDSLPAQKYVTVTSDPISITLLPRTKEEMRDYVQSLTNQLLERLGAKGDAIEWPNRYANVQSLACQLMYTCSPEIVPTFLKLLDEGSEDILAVEALAYYVPHTQEIKKAILEKAVKHGLDGNWTYLLRVHGVSDEEIHQLEQSHPPQPKSTNSGATPPITTDQTSAAAESSNPRSPIRNPQSEGSSKPAANPSGIALEIQGPANVVKQGDEIPIRFILSNHGTNEYQYQDRDEDQSDGFYVNKLSATTESGVRVPSPFLRSKRVLFSFLDFQRVLHPGDTYAKVIPLNRRALMQEAGSYVITGTTTISDAHPFFKEGPLTATSGSIRLTVLPRTKEEMADYIQGLTNQIAARLAIEASQHQTQDEELRKLVRTVAYTCSPEMVPILLRTLYESSDPANGAADAIMYYAPRTDQTWKAIFDAAAKNRDMNLALTTYWPGEKDTQQTKPLMQRALAADNMGQWELGARLAWDFLYDDALTPRLCAIASLANAPGRYSAIYALAINRTDAGVNTLKALVNDTDIETSVQLASDIQAGYNRGIHSSSGNALQPGDFTTKDVEPLVDRLLASNRSGAKLLGRNLAALIRDISLPPKPVDQPGQRQLARPSPAGDGDPIIQSRPAGLYEGL